MEESKKKKFNLIIMLLFCSCSLKLFSQTEISDIPVIQYENQNFIQDLPYGRPFIIEVPTIFNGQKSNICGIVIKEKDEEEQFAAAYDWIDIENKDQEKFELIIKKDLKFNKNYEFKLTFLLEGDYSITEDILKQIIHLTREKFDFDGRIYGNEVEEILRNLQDEIIESGSYTTFEINSRNIITLSPEKVRLFEFPFITSKGVVSAEDFADLAREQFFLENTKDSKEDLTAKIRKSKNDNFAFLDSLEKCDGNLSKNIEQIKNYLESQNSRMTSWLDFDALNTSNCKVTNKINALKTDHRILSRLERDFDEYSMNVKNIENKIGSLVEIVKDGIKLVGLATSYDMVRVSSAKALNKIQIGTAFAASSAFLNFGAKDGPNEASLFGYFALKFYLLPVDKGLKCPYLIGKFPNRASIYVGLKNIGDLKYRGASMTNFIGANPVVGLSYDIHRNFSIDFGTVFFGQNSVYPLVNKEKPFRTAMTVGISFDPDLINQFRSLVTDQNYKIP